MKTRIFHTKFWTDSYIRRLPTEEKLLFIYLTENEFINIISIFEMPLDIASSQTKIPEDRIKELLEKFKADEKIDICGEYIFLRNSYKYQYYKGPRNNHLKLRLIYELSDKILLYFQEPIKEIFGDVFKEHKDANEKDEKITNLIERVSKRLNDRGIYTPIYSSRYTGEKPETINIKPENKKGKEQESKSWESAREVAERLRPVGTQKRSTQQ